MTYNVHSCIGLDRRCSPHRISEIIARFKPDIVALQELDIGRMRTQSYNQVRIISELLHMFHHYHPAIQVEEEYYGNAILSCYPLRVRQAGLLPELPASFQKEPRCALWATVEIGGYEVQIINTHLGLGRKERICQSQALTGQDWLTHPDCRGPIILCGDFNAIPRSKPYRLISQYLQDIQKKQDNHSPRGTWPSFFPLARIDHIFVSSHFTVHRIHISSDKKARLASDHLPLAVELDLDIPNL